jgi:hypothetical protein
MADKSPSPLTDAQALALFVKRASKACQHPLASHELSMQITFRVTEQDGQVVNLDLDLHSADEESWQGLALQVRPLVFLKEEKLRLTRVMSIVGRNAESLKVDSNEITNKFLAWRSHDLFYVTDAGKLPPEEALAKAEYEVVSISHGPVKEVTAEVDNVGGIQTGDAEMADIVLYGELFHFDADKALRLEAMGTMTRTLYAKAAENRVRQSCYFLRHAVRLIEYGWSAGLLPGGENGSN